MTIVQRSSTNDHGSTRFFVDDEPAPFKIDISSDAAIPPQKVYGLDFCARGDELRDTVDPGHAIECDGYGCVTIIKAPIAMAGQIEQNLDTLVNAMETQSFDGKPYQVPLSHGNWRAVVVKDATEIWVFVVDGMATYCNYSFLLNGTAAQIKDEEYEFELVYRSKGATVLSGDENSDGQFSTWLEENNATIYKKLKKLGWISANE